MAKRKVAKQKRKTARPRKKTRPLVAKNIGILHSGTDPSSDTTKHPEINFFIRALRAAGVRPVLLPNGEPLWSDSDPKKLKDNANALADDRNIELIIAAGGSASVFAVKDATDTNRRRVVYTSFSEVTRPAPNMTGVCARTSGLDPARLALLYSKMLTALPGLTHFGVLENPTRRGYDPSALQDVADSLGFKLDRKSVYNAGSEDDRIVVQRIRDAFSDWAVAKPTRPAIKAALVAADPIFNDHRKAVIAAAKAAKIATMHQWSSFKKEGAYGHFGTDIREAYEKAAEMAAEVLINNTPPDQIQPYELPNTYSEFNPAVASASIRRILRG